MNFQGKSPKVLCDFLNYLMAIRNYSLRTIKLYNNELLMFFKFLKEYMSLNIQIKNFNIFILAQVKESTIIAYLVYSNYYRNNSSRTRQRKLSIIRSFFKWLFINYPPFNYMENPTKYIPNIEPVIRLPKYLNIENARKIQTIFDIHNSKFPIRNNMIITMFLHTGMRASELINLNISDINFSKKTIIVKGKNSKERVIYIDKVLLSKLKKYLKIRNKNKKILNMNDALFISYQNKRIGIDCVEDICAKAYKLMGLSEYGYNVHTLRHTAATLVYRETRDIVVLKEFLGHAQISTTEIYTHVINDEVKNAVNSNPLNTQISEKAA